MQYETELLKKIIYLTDRQEEIDNRINGVVNLVMESLDKVDEMENRVKDLEDKLSNLMNFIEKKELWNN